MKKRVDNEVKTSKTLSWLLRHGALQEGLDVGADGYIRVTEILQHPRYSRIFTLQQLQHIVTNDEKKRYSLRMNPTTGEHEIRANQGHSISAVDAEQSLVRIIDANEVPMAVHGTYYRHWDIIRNEGLRRMNRNHVHFAVVDAQQPQRQKQEHHCTEAISGFRSDCQILIYLDVAKAIQNGLALFRSENNVILCAGLSNGVIPVKYFAKAIDRRTSKCLSF